MSREIAVTFALGASLGGGFKAAFQGAQAQARAVAGALRQMERTPVGKLGAQMEAQRAKIKGLSGSLGEARTALAALNARAAASGGATGMLARQIGLCDMRVKNLSGALDRQLGLWRNTTAQAATASGSVHRLAEDYALLSARMDRAKKAQQGLHAVKGRGEDLRAERADLHGRLLGAAGAAAAVAVPAKLSIDFEDAIARVGAIADASSGDMERLTAKARELGRDTVFSATQAAEGMQYLAMAGFDTEETIAAMPGMLDLAAAGNTDLARTADIASDILSAFKLKAEDMGQVGDTLARAFTTSNTDLEKLGDTMKYVGPVAASLGISLQDTSAMAGLLGNVGIKGSQAGTVMRAAFLRLAAPPKMAKDALGELAGVAGPELDELFASIDGETGGAVDALKEMGMTAKDEAGNLRPLADILEELNARTAGMGGADKEAVFKKVFGTEAAAGMTALAEQASVTVDKQGKAITDSLGRPTNALRAYMEQVGDYEGTAARMAKRMNDTTGGALRRLKSAWEDVGISVGDLFLPVIQGVAEGLAGMGNALSGAIQHFPVLSRVVGISAGALGALYAASVGYGLLSNTLKTGLNVLRGAFFRVAASQAVTAAATTAAGGAFSLAGAASRFFAGGLRSILMATGVGALLVGIGYGLALLIDNWEEVSEAFGRGWAEVKKWGAEAFECVVGIWQDAELIFGGVVDGIKAIFKPFFEWLHKHFAWVFSAIDAVGSAVSTVTGTIGRAWDKVFGNGDDPAEAAQNSAPAASGAPAAPAASGAPAAPAASGAPAAPAAAAAAGRPGFKPVSASAVAAASGAPAASGAGKGKGRRAGSGAGGGGSRAGGGGSRAGGASGAGGGPVTVVTLGGDNAHPQTLFFPAGKASMPATAAAQAAAGASQSARALPQAPGLAKAALREAQKAGSPGSVTVDLTQNFDLIAGDARAVRKVLESIKPDMEALVRRALDKLQSDRSRTAYAQ